MALRERFSISQIIESVYNNADFSTDPLDFCLPHNPFTQDAPGIRPNSVSAEGATFGDEGKGRVMQEVNQWFITHDPSGRLYSMVVNGGRNAGHEVWIGDRHIAFHQIPVAIILEGSKSIISKNRLVHAADLVSELQFLKDAFGGKLPGDFAIDSHAILSTDLHAAFETFTKQQLNAGKGSTGSGISQGYASFYEKRAITMGDLADESWKQILKQQYEFYAQMLGGEDALCRYEVNRLMNDGKRKKQKLGTKLEFLDQMEEVRGHLLAHIQDTADEVYDIWHNTTIPFTFEASQAAGLDPFHGVAPDYTASRTMIRLNVADATEGTVQPDKIAMRLGVIKLPYMSSVGSRIPPYALDEDLARRYRNENDERGRSTGRDRGIYPIDLVMIHQLNKTAQYTGVVFTHADSAHKDKPVQVVFTYEDKNSGEERRYRPYQDDWDSVTGRIAHLDSWDGKLAAKARTVEELPRQFLQFTALISKLLDVPVVFVTNGKQCGDAVLFWKKIKKLF